MKLWTVVSFACVLLLISYGEGGFIFTPASITVNLRANADLTENNFTAN